VEDVMDGLAMIGFLVLWVLGGAAYVYFVAQPLFKLPQAAPPPSRFSLADLFWLFVLLQYPMVFLSLMGRQYIHQREPIILVVGGLLLVAVVVFLWWRCANWLSQVGVTSVLRRGVFLVVVVPIAVLGSLAGIPVILESVVESLRRGLEVPMSGFTPGPAALVVAVISGLLGHCLTRWVVAGATTSGP
jgi:hypothetical protein